MRAALAQQYNRSGLSSSLHFWVYHLCFNNYPQVLILMNIANAFWMALHPQPFTGICQH